MKKHEIIKLRKCLEKQRGRPPFLQSVDEDAEEDKS